MKKTKVGLVMLIEIISLVLALFLMTGILGDMGMLIRLLDMPSLLILLLLALPALFANGLAGDFARLFKRNKDRKESLGDLKRSLLAIELLQKQFIYAGLVIIAFEIVFVLSQLSEPEIIGPNLAVVMIIAFYTGILELLLMPLNVAVEKRITEYMEEGD